MEKIITRGSQIEINMSLPAMITRTLRSLWSEQIRVVVMVLGKDPFLN
jgi:hypothetical protein